MNPSTDPSAHGLRAAFRAALRSTPLLLVLYAAPAAADPTPDPGPDPAGATKLSAVEVEGGVYNDYQVKRSTTATKTDTPLLDVPQSLTVITGEMIRDQAMLSMADVVRYVPGVQMAQGEGHRDAPILRGNTTTADFYLNGVRDDVQ